MLTIDKYIPVTKAKNDLLEIIRRVELGDDAVALTKNGVPTAVILGMKQFKGLLETLEILSDKKTLQSLRKGIRQAQKRRWISDDEIFRR